MIDDWRRVTEFFEFVAGHVVIRVVNRLALEVFKLRHPISNVIAVGVTLLRLRQGIEDPL